MTNLNDTSLYLHITPRISNIIHSPNSLVGIEYAKKYLVLGIDIDIEHSSAWNAISDKVTTHISIQLSSNYIVRIGR